MKPLVAPSPLKNPDTLAKLGELRVALLYTVTHTEIEMDGNDSTYLISNMGFVHAEHE